VRPFFLEAPPRRSVITLRVNVKAGRCLNEEDLASVPVMQDTRHIARAIDDCINLIVL
jgi:hypothetical protein